MRASNLLAALAVLVLGAGRPQTLSAQSASAGTAFDKLKSLAGEWQGSAVEGGKELPAATSFRLVSDGSVVMDDLAPGTSHEMITMFHLDGGDLMATHYCAARNQPRFRLVPAADPNVLAFEFKDATNLPSPAAPHRVAVKFTLVDPNRHWEDWTFQAKGRLSTRPFDFHRRQ